MKDYYKILQVHPEASLEVMNNAYRALVKQYHPDRYHTHRKTALNEKMQEINEAYQVLSNPASRAEYDRRYHHKTGMTNPEASNPTSTMSHTIRRMLLWGIGTYLVVRFLLAPFLSNPVLKILILFAVIFGLIRIYSKRKPTP